MSLEVLAYAPEWESRWDGFCVDAVNSTFLHRRRFLSYHGARFVDASALVLHEGSIVGLLPAAALPGEPRTVVSHPGATFGGIVHQGWLVGQRMIDALGAICRHYAAQSYSKLTYKAVPYTYTTASAQDDLYALFRLAAVRTRCDLSSTIDLAARRPASERRRRGLKKAQKIVSVAWDMQLLPELWRVLEQNLAAKYGARPVHSLGELCTLIELFPADIRIACALVEERVEAGIVLFNSNRVWHTQYVASSEDGYAISALDAVFDAAIAESGAAGARYFDFGTSNEDAGRRLNDGLYRFKSEFGGGGVAHEYYELELSESRCSQYS